MYESKALFDILKGLSAKISKPLFDISAKYDEELQEAIEDDGYDETFEENNFNFSLAFEESQEEINKERVVSEHGEEAYKVLKEKGVFYPHMDTYFKQLNMNEFQYYPEEKKYYTSPGCEKFDAQDTCID